MAIKIMKMNEEEYKKIFVVTDIHGRYDLFKRLLEELNFTKEDLLIILGDSCDRGALTYELYKKYMKLQNEGYSIIHLLGNHEDMFNLAIKEAMYSDELNMRQDHYFRNNGLTTLQSFYPEATVETRRRYFRKFAKENKSLRKWIKNLLTRYESKDYYFVHAGVDFDKYFWNQNHRDMIWIREPFLSSEKSYDKKVFHGHSPVKDEPYYEVKDNRINIDGGCVYGGKLNIIVIEEGKIDIKQSSILEEDIYNNN